MTPNDSGENSAGAGSPTGVSGTPGGGASGRRVPQLPQKRIPGGFWKPQLAQSMIVVYIRQRAEQPSNYMY
jgi:hypothetical protein